MTHTDVHKYAETDTLIAQKLKQPEGDRPYFCGTSNTSNQQQIRLKDVKWNSTLNLPSQASVTEHTRPQTLES